MAQQVNEKRERILEAVRCGLEGDASVDFVRQSGYAMTPSGIARHLRKMGGRGKVEELIAEGKTNLEILERAFPEEDLTDLRTELQSQGELFPEEKFEPRDIVGTPSIPLYETTKISVRVPSDLYTAIRLAAHAENKPQNDLIVDILTAALSQMPRPAETSDE